MDKKDDIKMPQIEAGSDTEDEVETVEYVPVKKDNRGKTGKNTNKEYLSERARKGNEKWRQKINEYRQAEQKEKLLQQQLSSLQERLENLNTINAVLAKSVKTEEVKTRDEPKKLMTRAEMIANSKIGYSKFNKRK
jgi:uncharacterized membrane protein YgaE (UPF0421/DUF939 family)